MALYIISKPLWIMDGIYLALTQDSDEKPKASEEQGIKSFLEKGIYDGKFRLVLYNQGSLKSLNVGDELPNSFEKQELSEIPDIFGRNMQDEFLEAYLSSAKEKKGFLEQLTSQFER